MRQTVLTIAILGALVCALLLALSYARPLTIETWAREAIALELKTRVETDLGKLSDNAIVRRAEQLIGQNNQAIKQASEPLARELGVHISVTMKRMLDPACPCRALLLATQNEAERSERNRLLAMNARIAELVENKYAQVAGALLHEVRIFSASNGVVFLLLALVAWRWKRASLQLLAPAAVLLGAAAIIACMYLLNQNWLQTILLGDYVGYLYIPYLAAALVFMADVVFNRARLSSLVVRSVFTAAGSAVVPC